MRAVIWCAVSKPSQATPDKISLELQETRAREWCERNGYNVVDVLIVPGISRSEEDIVKMLDDYAAVGCFSYHRLREHWYANDFDVLVAFAYDRLSRSTTGTAWVIANTINKGKRIYLLEDGGFISSEDYRFKAAIAGMTVTSPIDNLRVKGVEGKKKLVERGLPIGGKIPTTHKLQRDESGKAAGLMVDETQRPFFNALAQLLLKGVGFTRMPFLLAEMGHFNTRGNLLSPAALHNLLYNPMTWGHMGFRHSQGGKNPPVGRYIYDEDAPCPDGVLIVRSVVPAIWKGAIADDLKAELRRRSEDVRGRAKPHNPYRFTGIAICGECGWSMSVRVVAGKRRGLLCGRAGNSSGKLCSQTKFTPAETIETFIKAYVAQMQVEANNQSTTPQTSDLLSDLQKLERQIERLLDEQSLAPQNLRDHYRKKIEQLGAQLAAAQANYQHELHTTQERARQSIDTQMAMGQLQHPTFWEQADLPIQQTLKRLFGSTKLVILDRQVTGLKVKVK